jgi:beta-galactosidase GanA
MNVTKNKLRFGVSYCPYAKSGDTDMKNWERDIHTIKELHFNTLRCFVSWDRIEMDEGHYDYSKVDRIFELAEKYKLDVILNIGGVFATYGGIYPPRWLIQNYHCQHVVENPKMSETPFGPYRMLCLDDPIYQSKAEAFTVQMIRRYADRENLCGWNVWNEADQNPLCYCPLTLAKFRNWLKAKYQNNLDQLNLIWGTEFPLNYHDWNEVEPGLGSGFLSNGYVARLDWLKFNRERVTSWLTDVSRLVHQNDSRKLPTTSNIVPNALDDGGIWSQNREVNIAGISYYTFFNTPSAISAGLGIVRGSTNDPQKGFWILETEAGQMGNSALYPNEVADGPRREATHWLSILHGAKTILLWKFGGRVTDNQTDHFNLIAWDGSVTDRALMNAKVAKTFLENESLFLNKSYRSKVAILCSTHSTLFSMVQNSHAESINARNGAYKILRDLHIPCDFVSDVQLLEERLSEYQVVILPRMMSLTKPVAEKLKQFVQQGGTLIADRGFGIYDENGWIFERAPGHEMIEAMGGYINDFLLGTGNATISCTPTDDMIKTTQGPWYAAIHPDKNAEIIGTYPNGSAAVLQHRFGQGQTFWFGTDIWQEYEKQSTKEIANALKWMLSKSGIESDYILHGENLDEIEIGVMTDAKGKKIHFLINLDSKDKTFDFSIRSAKDQTYRDLLSNFVYDGKNNSVRVTLPAWKTIILVSNKD